MSPALSTNDLRVLLSIVLWYLFSMAMISSSGSFGSYLLFNLNFKSFVVICASVVTSFDLYFFVGLFTILHANTPGQSRLIEALIILNTSVKSRVNIKWLSANVFWTLFFITFPIVCWHVQNLSIICCQTDSIITFKASAQRFTLYAASDLL